MKTAKLIEDLINTPERHQAHWLLSDIGHVVISKLVDDLVTETYVFSADSEGDVTDYIELPMSRKGLWDHVEILKVSGYEVVA